MAKRRGNYEGTIKQRKNELWEAIISIGRDPVTGKLKRVSFYAPTQKELVAKAAKARADLARGTFVAPEKLTLGAWLDTWLKVYKASTTRPLTLSGYARILRRHLQPSLGHTQLQALKPEHIQLRHTLSHWFAAR